MDEADSITIPTTGTVAGMSEIGALPSDLAFTDNGDGTATISGTPQGVVGTSASSTTSTLTIEAVSCQRHTGQPNTFLLTVDDRKRR